MASFTFGQIEAVLGEIYRVPAHKRAALTSRLKHLQTHKLPAGPRPGRGKAASYSTGQFLQMAVGAEMMQGGLTPARSAYLVRLGWGYLRASVSTALRRNEVKAENARRAAMSPPEQGYADADWWMISTEAMSEPGVRDAARIDVLFPINAVSSRALSEAVATPDGKTAKRALLIYAEGLVAELAATVERLGFATTAELSNDLSQEVDRDIQDGFRLEADGEADGDTIEAALCQVLKREKAPQISEDVHNVVELMSTYTRWQATTLALSALREPYTLIPKTHSLSIPALRELSGLILLLPLEDMTTRASYYGLTRLGLETFHYLATDAGADGTLIQLDGDEDGDR